MRPLRPAATPSPLGVLIVGHGTTSVVGAEECRNVAAMATEILVPHRVELGFLELIEPSIEDAVASLAAAGCREVVVVPLLLFSAGHAQRDVPEAVRQAADARGIAVRQAGVIGCHDAVVELARLRHREAIADRPADGRTRVVVVGRGSSDPTAAAQLRGFAEQVFAGQPGWPTHFDLGFVAAARPTLDEAITAAIADGFAGRVVVHPHLLFHGHVEGQVAGRIDRASQEHSQVEWIVVARLGADRRVAAALADRARQAMEATSPSVAGAAAAADRG